MIISLYIMVVCIVFWAMPLEIIPASLRGVLLTIGIAFFVVADHCYEQQVREFKVKITELEEKISELEAIIKHGEQRAKQAQGCIHGYS